MANNMRNNKVEIIIELIEKSEERPTIRKISQETNIRYPNVYNIIKKLEKENIISLEKIGGAYICKLNKKPHPLIFESEYTRREELIKNKNIKILYHKLNSLNFPFIALIFGSQAKGTALKKSDIDLLIISEEIREKEIEKTISLLPLNIHSTSINYEEFLNMANRNEFSVVTEAIKNNVVLIGIEDYYRLVGNVGR